jgi:NB-ARC domain
MTIKLDLELDHHTAVPGGDTDAHARNASLYGAIPGHIAIGRYVLQIGDPSGAGLREASRAERARFRPRPTPILLRPRSIRGLLDRQAELTAILSALDAGLPIELCGEAGIGKTAVLRHLAHHPRAGSFVDGVVYLKARHQSSADLLQLIFEAFYESDHPCRPTEAEIRHGLRDKQALILLDDVHLTQPEVEQVIDIAPQSAFAMATRERCLWGEVRSLELNGLPPDDGVLLLEREIERALDVTERLAAASISSALAGNPLRILQAAAVIREQGISLDACARHVAPGNLLPELLASLDEKPRRALLALAALSGVPLPAQHVSGIAEVPDIEPSLMVLVRRGLVLTSQSRHQLADGVADQLRRVEDLNPQANRAITYFTAWAERYRRSPGALLEESEALLRAQQCAADARRSAEALRLGRLLEGALVVGARWGAWELALERCLGAAKAIGDRSGEAWALHELGTRAICLGNHGSARAALSQAVKLREAIDESGAASASRQNLAFVLAPVAEHSSESAAMPLDDGLDLASFPLRDETRSGIHIPKTTRVAGVASVAALYLAILGGLVYWVVPGRPFGTAGQPAESGSFRRSSGPAGATAPSPPAPRSVQTTEVPVTSVASRLEALAGDPQPTPPAPLAPVPDKAGILIFSPRPGSIATGGPTALCYAVSGALHVRIEPEIGDVTPASTLRCVRVFPARTTTYELSASGRDGREVRQQLVIVVR